MLVDTHAHLYFDNFKDDYSKVIERAEEAGVSVAVNVGVDVETSLISARLKNSSIQFYSTIGIHPHEAEKYAKSPTALIEKSIRKLEEIYHKYPDKVVAVGECGLDYVFEGNPDYVPQGLTPEQLKNVQHHLLTAQVELAKKLNLPLTIHCRDAWDDIFNFVGDYHGILHCYSGDEAITKKALKSNFLISFAATITYPKNEYLREAAKIIPLNKIVLETDCPFLPPQSRRGQRNEPSTVKEIAELIAQIKGMSYEEVVKQTTLNAQQLLKIATN